MRRAAPCGRACLLRVKVRVRIRVTVTARVRVGVRVGVGGGVRVRVGAAVGVGVRVWVRVEVGVGAARRPLAPVALRRVLCIEQREALQAAPLPLERRRRVAVVARLVQRRPHAVPRDGEGWGWGEG